MLWVPLCVSLGLFPPAGQPSTGLPVYPGIHAVRITTGSGEITAYALPPGTPPVVRAAFKAVEFAERDVTIADQLQQLKLDYVRHERALDNILTHRAIFGPGNATMSGPPYGAFPYYANFPPPASVSFPSSAFQSAFGGGGGGGGLFNQSPFASNPALKQGLAVTLANEATAERAQQLLDRMVAAHAKAAEVLRAYHAAMKPRTTSLPTPKGAIRMELTREELLKKLREADTERQAKQGELAVVAEGVLAKKEQEAERKEREVLKAERAASERYRNAEPDDRDAARSAWVVARDEWVKARREWDAARAMWEAARDILPAVPEADVKKPLPTPGAGG